MTECGAMSSRCYCVELEGHDPPHRCEVPDPTCGGVWADHPTDPDKIIVYRWPGIRGDNPDSLAIAIEEGLADSDEGVETDRPEEVEFIPGLGLMPKIRARRGGITFYPPPTGVLQ